MKYVGIDLHKKTISVCVVDKERKVLHRKKFLCVDVAGIKAWFGQLGKFQFGERLRLRPGMTALRGSSLG